MTPFRFSPSSRVPASPGRGRAAGLVLLFPLLLAVMVPTLAMPASTTARAAPTVSAAPVAVVAPPASAAVAPTAGGPAVDVDAVGGPDLWTWPVDPPHELLQTFRAPASAYAAGHRGIDVTARPGSPVRAVADGVVSFAGVVVDRPVLSIQHADGLLSSVEPVTATVGVGERVSAGQVVGVVAAGAHCDQRCVHLGVRRHGQYISPMFFFGGLTRAVLLPLPYFREP
jgi:murein DD-endopeptidase MepM/ murein hydrolase activator NlpD